MESFFTLFIITFTVICGSALFINFSKKRANKTKHGLSGMCHKTGGSVCCSCQSKMSNPKA